MCERKEGIDSGGAAKEVEITPEDDGSMLTAQFAAMAVMREINMRPTDRGRERSYTSYGSRRLRRAGKLQRRF